MNFYGAGFFSFNSYYNFSSDLNLSPDVAMNENGLGMKSNFAIFVMSIKFYMMGGSTMLRYKRN
jgi:hypothetical protein